MERQFAAESRSHNINGTRDSNMGDGNDMIKRLQNDNYTIVQNNSKGKHERNGRTWKQIWKLDVDRKKVDISAARGIFVVIIASNC
jgi:hypothetical protein